jgi:hypothetical protein
LKTDIVGKFIGDEGAFALMVSKNGFDWKPAKLPKAIGSSFLWANGEQSISRLERPTLYFENVVPKYLYGAIRREILECPFCAHECYEMLYFALSYIFKVFIINIIQIGSFP